MEAMDGKESLRQHGPRQYTHNLVHGSKFGGLYPQRIRVQGQGFQTVGSREPPPSFAP